MASYWPWMVVTEVEVRGHQDNAGRGRYMHLLNLLVGLHLIVCQTLKAQVTCGARRKGEEHKRKFFSFFLRVLLLHRREFTPPSSQPNTPPYYCTIISNNSHQSSLPFFVLFFVLIATCFILVLYDMCHFAVGSGRCGEGWHRNPATTAALPR